MAAKKKATDWQRIAVEGATTDGRVIQREWIEGAAASYNPEVYGARINCEHIRGYAPMVSTETAPFGAYGDVVALKAEAIPDGPLKGKLGLYAQLTPTDELVALNRKAQKVYSSVEIAPDFADTGTPYLMGMAVTDNPASLGTSYLQFCAQNPTVSPLAARHSVPGALFTAAEEITLAFAEEGPEQPEGGTQFFTRISSLLFGSAKKQEQNTTELQNAVELIAQSQANLLNSFSGMVAKDALSTLEQQFSQLEQDHNALKSQLENEPQQYAQRPPATGKEKTETEVDY